MKQVDDIDTDLLYKINIDRIKAISELKSETFDSKVKLLYGNKISYGYDQIPFAIYNTKSSGIELGLSAIKVSPLIFDKYTSIVRDDITINKINSSSNITIKQGINKKVLHILVHSKNSRCKYTLVEKRYLLADGISHISIFPITCSRSARIMYEFAINDMETTKEIINIINPDIIFEIKSILVNDEIKQLFKDKGMNKNFKFIKKEPRKILKS